MPRAHDAQMAIEFIDALQLHVHNLHRHQDAAGRRSPTSCHIRWSELYARAVAIKQDAPKPRWCAAAADVSPLPPELMHARAGGRHADLHNAGARICTEITIVHILTIDYERPPPPTAPLRGCWRATKAPSTMTTVSRRGCRRAMERQRQQRCCKLPGDNSENDDDAAESAVPLAIHSELERTAPRPVYALGVFMLMHAHRMHMCCTRANRRQGRREIIGAAGGAPKTDIYTIPMAASPSAPSPSIIAARSRRPRVEPACATSRQGRVFPARPCMQH
jgi:hypothetical protein